jgi:putative ABC transport system permease protein
MRWFKILRLRMRSLLERDSVERDLADEVQFHLKKQIERNVAAGMNREEARRAALLEFGNVRQQTEECRDARGTRMIENFADDLRHALRGLRRDPVLALTAAATLAICIGANTTVFSVVNSILLRPLSYPGAERVYWISERSGREQMELAAGPDYYRLREENHVFEDVGAYSPTTVNWTGIEKPEQLDVAQVTHSFFRVLGSQPMLGRYLAEREEGAKAPPVVVVSYAFWRSRMASDPKVLGRTITLDGLPYTIIGVMPQGFDYPRDTQIWQPLDMDRATQLPMSPMRPIRIVSMLARSKPRVSDSELVSDMGRVSHMIGSEYPKEFTKTGFRSGLNISAIPLQKRMTGDLKPALVVLGGAVSLVLLIACVNLANLLLARASARRREMAVRLALGANRGRVVRQMLTESVVLALPGGLTGIAMAWLAVHLLNATKPLILLRYPAVSLDLRTLGFTFLLTLLTGLIFGMAPALAAARITIHDTLKGASHTQSGARNSVRLRQSLVVAELSVSLVLLIGAGLLARSFLKLATAELGFPSDHLLTFRVNLTRSRYATGEAQLRFYDEVLERLKQLPTVRAAAISDDLPLRSDFPFGLRIQAAGHTPVPVQERPEASLSVVSPAFFRTLGIPVKAGRLFGPEDTNRATDSIVINQALASRVFPGEDPVGQRIVVGPNNGLLGVIVGVVGNIRSNALGAEASPVIYRCTTQGQRPFLNFLNRMAFTVRTSVDPSSAIRDVEAQVYAVDRNQAVFDVRTMEERLERALSPRRFQLLLIGSFSIIALLMAAAGVYGVMSYLVTGRTREIGIRMAMGARPPQVLTLVLRESVALVLVAILAGLGGAWALTRYVKAMLYGVTTLDTATFAFTPLLLGAIVLLASIGPARRASRVDPMNALREE